MVTQPCKDCPDRHIRAVTQPVTGTQSSAGKTKNKKDAIKAIRAESIQLLKLRPEIRAYGQVQEKTGSGKLTNIVKITEHPQKSRRFHPTPRILGPIGCRRELTGVWSILCWNPRQAKGDLAFGCPAEV